MPIVTHVMLNHNFPGDSANVLAVSMQFPEALQHTYFDTDLSEVEQIVFSLSLNNHSKHVLLLAGTHGLDFLKLALQNEIIKQKIRSNELIISWGGHQAPNELVEYSQFISVVSLVPESVDDELRQAFRDDIVTTQMVPNTLTAATLDAIVENWDDPSILSPFKPPRSDKGYLCVMMPGDAPDENGAYKFISAPEGYALGRIFAHLAKENGKVLLATNGPRTGSYYPQSADLTKPVLTRYDDHSKQWLTMEQALTLTEGQVAHFPRSHSPGAPMDPISAAFLQGIIDSGIPPEQYRFFDFTFGNSAFNDMVAAAYSNRRNSYFFYGVESVSNAAILMHVNMTYAYDVGSMSNMHVQFADRFAKQGVLGRARFSENKLTISTIDFAKQSEFVVSGIHSDAQAIAARIKTKLAVPVHRPKIR